jgi:hypothetical protein
MRGVVDGESAGSRTAAGAAAREARAATGALWMATRAARRAAAGRAAAGPVVRDAVVRRAAEAAGAAASVSWVMQLILLVSPPQRNEGRTCAPPRRGARLQRGATNVEMEEHTFKDTLRRSAEVR